ncbi:MAG: HAD family hydrolase [Fimbriimonas sp.]
MIPRLVTFDCAQTLVEVDWTLDGFSRVCAREIGLDLPDPAFVRYRQMYFDRLPEFLAINLTRDVVAGQAFWDRLAVDWLTEQGQSPWLADPLRDAADRLGFGPDSKLFRMYDDVPGCLDELQAAGIRVAVVSNWDYSLHRVLRMFGIYDRFDAVLASLEEGVEKPDPRLFRICLDRLGVAPEAALHIGDNPLDDVEGAQAAGMRAVLIDRTGATAGAITSLREALIWSA